MPGSRLALTGRLAPSRAAARARRPALRRLLGGALTLLAATFGAAGRGSEARAAEPPRYYTLGVLEPDRVASAWLIAAAKAFICSSGPGFGTRVSNSS